MHNTIDINNILLSVIFAALGIIVPVIFHLMGLGSVFLPMFLPLSVGAYLLSPANAFIMGLMTPLISALLTGMPPFYPPMAFIMMAELSLFCLLISLLVHRTSLPVFVILIIAVIFDRALLALIFSFIMPLFNVSFKAYTLYDMIKSLPGIGLMFLLVPTLVPRARKILQKHSLHIFEHSHYGEE